MVERPDLAGRHVKVNVIVSSTSMAFLAPSLVYVRYLDRGFEGESIIPIPCDDGSIIKFIGVSEGVRKRRLESYLKDKLGCEKILEYQILKYRTVYRLRVRHPVITLEKRDGKILDEKGFEYKAYDIYISSDRELNLEPSSTLTIKGVVIPDPKTQKVTILAYEVDEYESFTKYDKSKLDELRELFEGKTIEERVNWILRNLTIYSHIVGRENLFLAGLLAYTTPIYIKLNNEVRKGWGNVLFMGDTTTGKSQVSKNLIKATNAGMYITAETASIAGLTGAATQIEKAGWFVDWGFLPLNGKKLLIIDGVQKLSKGAWAEIAEAEREGIARISKAAKNVAYARTRQIKIANPIDPQAGKFSTKKMNEFLYPIQALSTVFDRISIARLDLVVFTRERDVSIEDVNRRFDNGYDERIHYISEVVKWCWSNTAEVVFEEEAIDALLERATRLYNKFYYGDIPIVSIDMKWKLARLAVALAYLTLSSDENYKRVIVKREHVEYIADFIDREYTEAGLHILAESARYEKINVEEAEELIQRISIQCNISEDTVKDVISFIVLKGRVTRDQIMQKYGLSENTQLRPLLATLSSEDLVKTGRGIYPNQS